MLCWVPGPEHNGCLCHNAICEEDAISMVSLHSVLQKLHGPGMCPLEPKQVTTLTLYTLSNN